MPSPIAHSFAALALRHLTGSSSAGAEGRAEGRALLGTLIVAANAPDFDFIPGILVGDPGRFHHGAAHSVFAAAVCGLAAALIAHYAGFSSARRFGVLVGSAFASHLLLDMLSSDHGFQSGVPAFWPVFRHAVAIPLPIFVDVKHSLVAGRFFASVVHPQNLSAMARECAIVVLMVGAFWCVRALMARLTTSPRLDHRAEDSVESQL